MAVSVSGCRKHSGWFCPALSAVILLASSVAAANTTEPALRRSEELDIRRLGRVSDDERSALRVAWRAAQTGAEEVRSVQDMLDSLRRMEATVSEIGRLVRDMPAPASFFAPVTVQAPEPAEPRTLWPLAVGALLALLAIWWFRRRASVPQPWVVATPATPATAAGDPGASALEASPAAAPWVGPLDAAVEADSKPPPGLPRRAEPANGEHRETPPSESYLSTVIIEPPPAAPAATEADLERTVSLAAAKIGATVAPPAARAATVDFSLENATPEAAARANARVPVPRTNAQPRVPERRQELHVEPTLQLAEIMLSMGLQQGAAKALVEYVEAHPREAVYHWLKLLGIYRDGGRHNDFKETAAKLRKHFNIHAQESPSPDGTEAPTLESFPRVAQQVQQTWPRPDECIAYLQHLLKDNRDGERTGFPQSVAEEFLLLIEVLKGTSGATQSVGL